MHQDLLSYEFGLEAFTLTGKKYTTKHNAAANKKHQGQIKYEHEFINAQQKIFKKLALVKAEDFIGQYPETCSRCDKPFKSIIIKIAHILKSAHLLAKYDPVLREHLVRKKYDQRPNTTK
nr:unnamed protein product [Callosobruchus analis]